MIVRQDNPGYPQVEDFNYALQGQRKGRNLGYKARSTEGARSTEHGA